MDHQETKDLIKRYKKGRAKRAYREIFDFNRYLSKDALILDAGSGIGESLLPFDQFSPERKIGIDIYNHKKIRPQLIVCDFTHVVGNALEMPFKAESFDLIICSHSIEHFKKPQGIKLIALFPALLKENGFVLIATPNRRGLTRVGNRLFKKIGLYGLLFKYFLFSQTFGEKRKINPRIEIWFHPYEYCMGELEKLLEKDFTIIEKKYYPTIEWYSFTKPISLLRKFMSWERIESILFAIDNLFDYLKLSNLKVGFYLVTQKKS